MTMGVDRQFGNFAQRSASDDNALVVVVIALALACGVVAGVAVWWALPPLVSLVPALAMCGGLAAAFTYGGFGRARNSAERERAESEADLVWELQESVAHYRALIDTLGDLVVHRDGEGRILFANVAFARFAGRSGHDVAGKTFSELGLVLQATDDTTEQGGTETVALERDGVTRWFSWTTVVSRHPDSGAIVRQAIGRDITDSLHAKVDLIDAREKALQASRAKSRFLATVSHEIRTPLNGIIGMAKLLADTELSPEQRTYTDAVSNSGVGLLALIEDLLDFSRIEAGRFEPQYAPVSIRELTEGVVELLAPRAHAKGIGIATHIARNVPETVTSDGGRLRQVLINLIGNAVKFTETGGVLVSVNASAINRDRTVLSVAVEDTGPGIAKADQMRIFAEFEQGDQTTTRRHGGAGLGLAISRSIVEALGGSIAIDSDVGRGAVFTLTLPAGTTAPAQDAPVDMPMAGQDFLIISNNAIESRALVQHIRDQGGTAFVSARGHHLKSWAGRRFEAVLIEPDCDALNGRAELQRHGIEARRVIVLIRADDRARLLRLAEDGFDAFLARPVRRETLNRILTNTASSGRPASAGKPSRAKKGRRRSMTVLVAEDNEINALLVHVALTKAGYNVEIVGDGQSAVERACDARRNYDVILMDLHMPVMDGPEAIAHIRRHEEEKGLLPMPILALTADSQSETREAVLAHGATGFLTKPVDPVELARIVGEAKAA